MIKVCLLATNDLLGDPRVARHADSLGRHGFDVVVVGLLSERSVPEESLGMYRAVRVRLGWYERTLRLLRRVKETAWRSSSEPSDASGRSRPSVRWLTRFFLSCVWFLNVNLSLVTVARKLHADIYTCNDLDTLLTGLLLKKLTGARLVYDSHELYVDYMEGRCYRWFLRRFEGFLIKRVDAIMTVNPFIAEELAERYSVPVPHVVMNCVKSVQTKAKPLTQTKIALYQGRCHWSRGLENLVRACEFLEKDVVVQIRGDGRDDEPKLKRLAEPFRNCMFLNPVPMNGLVEAASNADVGVIMYLPLNLAYIYASPNKLFEYIQAGLPVAASDLPFLRQIVEGQQIGLLFDTEDPRSIADAINQITRPEQLARLKANVQRIAPNYSWEREEQKLLAAYRDLVSKT